MVSVCVAINCALSLRGNQPRSTTYNIMERFLPPSTRTRAGLLVSGVPNLPRKRTRGVRGQQYTYIHIAGHGLVPINYTTIILLVLLYYCRINGALLIELYEYEYESSIR